MSIEAAPQSATNPRRAGATALVDDNGMITADFAAVGGRASRGFLRQAALDTWARWGARVGSVWIIAVAFGAAFAPFIANSYPYLVKVGGHWSSPLLRHLTPTDVIILIVTLTGLAMAA